MTRRTPSRRGRRRSSDDAGSGEGEATALSRRVSVGGDEDHRCDDIMSDNDRVETADVEADVDKDEDKDDEDEEEKTPSRRLTRSSAAAAAAASSSKSPIKVPSKSKSSTKVTTPAACRKKAKTPSNETPTPAEVVSATQSTSLSLSASSRTRKRLRADKDMEDDGRERNLNASVNMCNGHEKDRCDDARDEQKEQETSASKRKSRNSKLTGNMSDTEYNDCDEDHNRASDSEIVPEKPSETLKSKTTNASTPSARTSARKRDVSPSSRSEVTPVSKRLKIESTASSSRKLADRSNAATKVSKKNNASTPSSRLSKKADININSPSQEKTPSGKIAALASAKAARTPSSIYRDAKAHFRPSSTPSRLVGRVKERDTITHFFNTTVMDGKPGSMYISGCPGTGKTALLDEVVSDMRPSFAKLQHRVEVFTLNCMGLIDPKKVYVRLMEAFNVVDGAFGTPANDPAAALEQLFTTRSRVISSDRPKKMFLLIFDEIDHLITKQQDLLYRIFEWPHLKHSNVVVIGIANALNLLDAHLPRLSHKNRAPLLLNFNPYEVSEIAEIIKGRLRDVQATIENNHNEGNENSAPSATVVTETPAIPVMLPSAIELCARKVSGTGDLRRALDVCRQSIELVEQEVLKKASTTSSGAGDNEKGSVTLQDVPKVTIAHVLRATTSVTGSGPVHRVASLNAQQRAVLVALMMLADEVAHSSRNTPGAAKKAPSAKTAKDSMALGRLYESYMRMCHTGVGGAERVLAGGARSWKAEDGGSAGRVLGAISRSEFGDVITVLETLGLVNLHSAKEETNRKVELAVLPEQVVLGLENDPVMKEVFIKGMAELKRRRDMA